MQKETAANGETAALIRAGTPGAVESYSPPQWLADLRAMAGEMKQDRARPPSKPFGRWLGDFLDQDTPSGLLPAEEKLLFAAASGEACILEGRAVHLWAAFEAWRETRPEAPEGDLSFVEAIARFTEAQPEPIQDIIIEATRHAIEELRLPAYWDPKAPADVEEFALSQRRFLARLEAEATPKQTLAQARQDKRFYDLAARAVIESLTPKPYEPLKLENEWLNPMLLRDPLNLSAETREKIEAEPRLLRGFFDSLLREVLSAGRAQNLAGLFKADPGALREYFDTVFERYKREHWRWADPEDGQAEVRAQFLRFLALGGDDNAPVHESRLELHGAHVSGDLDFSGCTIPQPLVFVRCLLAGRMSLQNAVTKSLNFSASCVRSIDAANASVNGGVFLTSGFVAAAGVAFPCASIKGPLSGEGGTFLSRGTFAIDGNGAEIAGNASLNAGFLGEGGVFFNGAKIEGGLDASGGVFRNRAEDGSGVALGCETARIGGGVALENGFRSEGCVSFLGARIDGALNCDAGQFVNQTGDGRGIALDFKNANVRAGVSMGEGFSAEGEVRFAGARIDGDFCCGGGSFGNLARAQPETGTKARRAATAINLEGARIDGTLALSPLDGLGRAKTVIRGGLSLLGCQAHRLVAESRSWPRRKTETGKRKSAAAYISLDGLTYRQLSGSRDDAPATQKRWLSRQPPEHLGVNFRSQPFDQLIRAYRETGHPGHARAIAKFKEHRRYRARFINLWHGWQDMPKIVTSAALSPLNIIAWPFAIIARTAYRSAASIVLAAIWAFVAFGTAYWHGWGRLLLFLLVLWAAGGIFYREAAIQGSFAPSNPQIYLNKELAAKCGKNWTLCEGVPPELPGFSPFAYSLDTMLPVPALGQKHTWQPVDQPGKPFIIVVPRLVWQPAYGPISGGPDIVIEERPLPEGTVAKISGAQTLLSWGVLGLLIAVLIRMTGKA